MSNIQRRQADFVGPTDHAQVTIREATGSDAVAIERLAQLDSTRRPEGPMLIAEVGSEPRAAYSVHEGRAIANPFKHTAELVELLTLYARELNGKRGNLRHGGRRSSAPQPPGFGTGLLPRRLGRRPA